jgi:type IV secretory pathway TrbD component
MPLTPERFPVTRYFPSGTRYQLVMGCDGGLWLVLSILCALLGWTWRNVPGLIAAVGAYGVGVTVLRKIGRYDPLAVKVFVRNWQYELIYGARSKVSAQLRRLPKKWIA